MLGADAQSFVERQARLPDRAAGSSAHCKTRNKSKMKAF
jgi:hypothetical protein|tara:strand:- start:1402 stop:1518 length:117 start_codon:yes stop_codon:yes gene_type:complete